MNVCRAVSLVVFVSLSLISPATAEPAGKSDAEPRGKSENAAAPIGKSAREILHRLSGGVESFTLSNGIRVVTFKRNQAPVFSAQIWVKVGGVNEVPGTTGIAHLLEHMAFKGSKTIGTKDYRREAELLARQDKLIDQVESGTDPKTLVPQFEEIKKELESLWLSNEYATVYQKSGAVGMNAATSKDYTYYEVALPSTAFELWCWMESDKLLNPVFRQFYKEREVVMEERRMRTDDSPEGKLYETMLYTAFTMHPNRLPVIGWASDIQQLRTRDIQKLYKEYYRPDNIVIGLVGNLDVEKIKPQLEKYFGRLPKRETPIPRVRVVEAAQETERKAIVHFDAEPQFVLAFNKPVYPDKDDLQFAVLHSLLSDGRSSILNKELVQQKQIATGISTSEAPGELYPSLFYVFGSPARGVSNERMLKEVQDILDRFKTKDVSDEDLEAAKKRVRVDLLNTLSSNDGLVETLAHAELLWGDWQVLFTMYDTILGTTKEDIKRLAQKYFRTENRTVVFLEKKVDEKSVASH